MRATHVTAKHARASNLIQSMVECTTNFLNILLVLIHCRGHRVDRVQMDVVVSMTRKTDNSGRRMFPGAPNVRDSHARNNIVSHG